MSSASDISNLFQMLGVSPSHYQEVARNEQAQGSRGRWSMQTEVTAMDIVREFAARQAEAVRLAEDGVEVVAEDVAGDVAEPVTEVAEDAVEVATAVPQEPIAPTLPAVVSEPVETLQAAPEQPVLQSDPKPVIAAQEPAALSSLFARLREGHEPRADVPQRQAS